MLVLGRYRHMDARIGTQNWILLNRTNKRDVVRTITSVVLCTFVVAKSGRETKSILIETVEI